jgi:hypothetical protein
VRDRANDAHRDLIERARKCARPYRIECGKRFRLDQFDPGDCGTLSAADKPGAQEPLASAAQARDIANAKKALA